MDFLRLSLYREGEDLPEWLLVPSTVCLGLIMCVSELLYNERELISPRCLLVSLGDGAAEAYETSGGGVIDCFNEDG